MIISIHQPDYIPYIGYFYKISKTDKFVFLDDCQFSSDNMHHWNRIKTPQGECRLKVPVQKSLGDPINKVRTKDELRWKDKHLKTLQMNYSKTPYYCNIYPALSELLMNNYDNLADMNIAINTWIARSFGFNAQFYRSSDMCIDTVSEDRVIDICIMLSGSKYISGNGARAYQVEQHFLDRGVELIYTDYHPIEYIQQWKSVGFLENMSILDYVFNCGFDWDYIEKAVMRGNK